MMLNGITATIKKIRKMKKLIFACIAVGMMSTAAECATINLSWKDNSTDEDGFQIQRRLKADPPASFTEIVRVPANAIAFGDAGVQAGMMYCYRVRAFNVAGFSGWALLSNGQREACMLADPSELSFTISE